MRGVAAVESVLQDIRYGARQLRRAPIFTAVAVLSIAGGLAAGTGIFAFMHSALYRPLGVGDGRNLYAIFISNSGGGSLYGGSSYLDHEAFREAKDVLASTCATTRARANLVVTGIAGFHHGAVVSPGCFDALKLSPQVGQFFSETQLRSPGDPIPIVISHPLWIRRFGRDPSVVGRTVLLNGMSVAVTAVAPRGFAGTSLDGGADFWAPVDVAPVVLPPGMITQRGYRGFRIFARLREGVDRQRAEAVLAVIAARLRQVDDRAWSTTSGATRRVTVMRETEARFADTQAGVGVIIGGSMAAVAIIVAIACLNLGTMLVARGAARLREMSIRLAIGASRGRVLRQLATESLMIAALGTAIAIGVLEVGVRVFAAYRPAVMPAFDVAIDGRVVAFASGLAVLAALFFGLAPARHTVGVAVAGGLRGGIAATRRRWFRAGAHEALIVLQVAVSIALLLVSTLFTRSMVSGTPISPGFSAAGVAVATVHLDAVADSEVPAVTQRLLRAAAPVSNVDRVSLASLVPTMGSSFGFEASVDGGPPRVFYGNAVSPRYFETLAIPIRAGRDFDERDVAGGQPVAIVSETFARTVWGTLVPAGRTVTVNDRQLAVVGVVADIRYRSLSEPPLPLIYLPIGQNPRERFIVHARVRGGGETFAALDAAMRAVDPRLAIEEVVPMRSYLDLALAPERTAQWVGAVVGIVQFGLAVMALWGLVAYAVERRTPELGIRLALGATPTSLVRLTMRPAGVSILAGVVVGTAIGIVGATVMQAMSVGLPALDLRAAIPVAATFTVAALAAAWWPARRAGALDPVASLRKD